MFALIGAVVAITLALCPASRYLSINYGTLVTEHALLAQPQVDGEKLEEARHAYFRAMDLGYDRETVLQRLKEVEAARWRVAASAARQANRSADAYQAATYVEWTRALFDRHIIPLAVLDHPDWIGLGETAGDAQMWSLSAYFFSKEWRQEAGCSSPRLCLKYGEALLRLGQFPEAIQVLNHAMDNGERLASVLWLLAEAQAGLGHWDDAARSLESAMSEAPATLQTAEAGSFASLLQTHTSLSVPAELSDAWRRELGNLVVNGGFETGYQPWNLWPEPGVDHGLDQSRSYSGLRSFRVHFDGSHDVNYYEVYQAVTVRSGGRYRLSGQIWAEQLTGLLGIEVRSGEWLGGNTLQVSGSTQTWQPVDLVFTVPPGIDQVLITIRRYGGNGALSGTAWVDDVILAPEPFDER